MKRYDIRYITKPEFKLQTLSKDDDGNKTIERFEPPFKPYCYVERPVDHDGSIRAERASNIHEALSERGLELHTDETYEHNDLERSVWKVTGDQPWDIKNLRYDDDFDFETFEADVPYARRVMIDEGIQPDVPDEEDILYFDIEVDPRGEFPDPEEAKKQVLSIAWADGAGNEGFICHDDEELVFEEFFDLLDDYFVIAGWNSETFDWPYLKNRLKIMPFNYDEFEVVHLDLQYLFMHVNREERQSFALDAVGQDEVGMGKTMSEEDHEMGYEVLWHWFKNDRDTLEEYNVEDARITAAIDEKYRLTRIVFRICRRGFTRPSGLMYNTDAGQVNMATGKACDSAILNANDDYVFNDKGKYRDLHDFPGGKVIEPNPGVYSDVMTADFSGMYPAIIRDFNVGARSWLDADTLDEAVEMAREKFDDDSITEDDIVVGVGNEPDGMYTGIQADNVGKARGFFVHPDIAQSEIAQSMDEIESLRKEFKRLKKQASKGSMEWHMRNNQDRGLKVLANTFFGVGASPVHRYYVPGMSENITETGQNLTIACKLWAEDNLAEVEQVIYGDTDSVMFELKVENAEVDMSGFDEYASEFIEEVGPDNELDMGIKELRRAYKTIQVAERTADKLNDFVVEYVQETFNSPGDHMEMDLDDVWTRYLITDKKKKYSGYVVYDDGPCAYHKTKGFKCIKANTCDAIASFQKRLIKAQLDEDPTTPIIEQYKDDLFNGLFDEQMVQHTRLNKMPDEYETLMAHARAAKKIIEREGDKGAVRTGDKIQYLKYGDATHQVMPTDNGIDDFRPNERYDEERDRIVNDPDGAEGVPPRLRSHHYSYLWSNRFESIMDLLGVEMHTQTSLAAY